MKHLFFLQTHTFSSSSWLHLQPSKILICTRCTCLFSTKKLSRRNFPRATFRNASEKEDAEPKEEKPNEDQSEKPRLDWEILRKRMEQVSSKKYQGPPADSIPLGRPPSKIWVLLFNPSTLNQGIYSLKVGGVDVVLAFQEQEEAKTYAALLEAQDFPKPVPELISFEEIADFCKNSGLRLGFVPKGALLSPPRRNSEEVEKWQNKSERRSEQREEENRQIPDDQLEEMKRKLEDLFHLGP
eukprot:jgi/Galph1/3471/GphlegSOOS_G2160.1